MIGDGCLFAVMPKNVGLLYALPTRLGNLEGSLTKQGGARLLPTLRGGGVINKAINAEKLGIAHEA